MGQYKSIPKVSFEDVQDAQKSGGQLLLIHTLQEYEESALIAKTLRAHNEVSMINKCIENDLFNTKIIVYGKNSCDESSYEKYQKLLGLGVTDVYVYPGGLFEWLCLQDIYGYEEFPTNGREIDILKYKPEKKINVINGRNLLENYR